MDIMALEHEYSFITPKIKERLLGPYEISWNNGEYWEYEGWVEIIVASSGEKLTAYYSISNEYCKAKTGEFMQGYLYIENVEAVVKKDRSSQKSLKTAGPDAYTEGCLEIFDYVRWSALCRIPNSERYLIVELDPKLGLCVGDSFEFRGRLTMQEAASDHKVIRDGKVIWIMEE